MNCIHCFSENTIKNGLTKAGVQTFKCKCCGKRYQKHYFNQSWLVDDLSITKLVKEGVGIRGISRLLCISPTTVISRIKSISMKIKRPFALLMNKEYEIDELCTYVKWKGRRVWVTYAIQRDTKNVVDFIVGGRSRRAMRFVVQTVLLSNPKKVFTDRFKNYLDLIPKQIHSVKRRGTNHIERKNLTLRTHLKRLNRKTICYSKSLVMLMACLKIYFWS